MGLRADHQFAIEDGRPARASRVFKQYLSDCAPPADAEYDAMYQAGLQATGTDITPLQRRDRFFHSCNFSARRWLSTG